MDVTLIADDGEQVQAHKNVLSSCSEFFKSILKTIPHHHPVIYLSGIRAENLLLALDYIYHGEVKISKDSLYDFLRVAQKLKLEELKVDIDNDITDLNELNDPNDLNDLNDQNTIENDECKVEPQVTEDEEILNSEPLLITDDSKLEALQVLTEDIPNSEQVTHSDEDDKISKMEKSEAPQHEEDITNLVFEELKRENFDLDDDLDLDFDEDEYDYYEELPLPEHEFLQQIVLRKGIPTTTVSLRIGNRMFRNRRTFHETGKTNFTCNGCEKYRKSVHATGRLVDGKYKLLRFPPDEKHICSPDNPAVNIRLAKTMMKEKIINEPTRSLPDIYKEVLDSYSESLEPQMRESFLESFPKFKNFSPSLYKIRREYKIAKDGEAPKKRRHDDYYYPKDHPLPEHKFQFKKIIGETGSMRGVPSTKVWLVIENRIYRRRRDAKGRSRHVLFSCSGCEKKGKHVSALALIVEGEYKLSRYAREEHHLCSPNNFSVDVKTAMKLVNDKVLEEPNRSIGEIYREVKESYAQTLEPERREKFLESFNKPKNILGNLYRRRMILRNSQEQQERLEQITSHYSPTFAPFFAL